jgi:hypothetical protein
MAFTAVEENVYKFAQKRANVDQVSITNGTTRTLLSREMVVVVDGNGLAFIGFVAEADGIAASATGMVDLMSKNEIETNQFTAGAFTAGDVKVWVTPQTNSVPATIKVAGATGDYPLNALIKSYNASGTIRLLMPEQDGTAAAVV